MIYDLSVILPVFNVEHYLSNCLDSLLKQSFQGRMQIILVEDKSTDNSLAICREYVSSYENIILIEHVENGGSAVSRNTGLQEAIGTYFVFVDPDDFLPENALDTLFNAIEKSEADIVKGSNSSFSNSKVKDKSAYSVNRIEEYRDESCLTVLLKHEKLRGHPWGKIFRASAIKGVSFTPGYRMTQDLLFCAEAFSKASHLVLIPDVVYQYRIHSGGATGRKYETGAYLSWIRCISEIRHHVTTKSQISAYQELKIRTLMQMAREIRKLRGNSLSPIVEAVNKARAEWVPSFWRILLENRLPTSSVIRYTRFCLTMRKINRLVESS